MTDVNTIASQTQLIEHDSYCRIAYITLTQAHRRTETLRDTSKRTQQNTELRALLIAVTLTANPRTVVGNRIP